MASAPVQALDPMPDAQELLAAKQAGKTLVEWRAMREPSRSREQKRRDEQKPRFNPTPDESLVAGPVNIVLPWSTLLGDNHRQTWVGTRMMTTKAYKLAKAKAVEAIETQLEAQLPVWRDQVIIQLPALEGPVAITVTLFEPNRSAKRDLLNYQKLICDAMSGVVYADDSLIDDAHFVRGTPDIDRPRAEITIRPLGGR